MERPPFETMEGQAFPLVRQVSVFLENRVGQLLKLCQSLEHENVKILALSAIDSGDCAIIRLIFDATDPALAALAKAQFPVSVAELVVVRLPPGNRAMMTIWSALLTAEINVSYAYPLLAGGCGPAIALSVDNVEIAVDTLQRHKFQVLGEADLEGL